MRLRVADESTRWDGNNHISIATGSQWDHERLYRSAKGKWLLRAWSQWQGSSESWTQLDDADAHAWLINHGHTSAVPKAALVAAEV